MIQSRLIAANAESAMAPAIANLCALGLYQIVNVYQIPALIVLIILELLAAIRDYVPVVFMKNRFGIVLMVNAFAMFISSMGPKMIGTSIGESGKSCLFKKKPISPKNNATNTSNRLSLFA